MSRGDAMDGTPTARLATFVAALEAELAPLHRACNEASWRFNLTGDPKDEQEVAALDTRIRTVLARPEAYRLLSALRDAGGIHEPRLARQLTLLHNEHRAHQVPPGRIEQIVRLEKALESRFNNFRAELDGERVSDNRIKDILRESGDLALRRRAWEASKQVGAQVAPELLGLVRLRNQTAEELGFPNWYSMMLTLDELDEAELFALLDGLESATRPLWQAYKGSLDARIAARFGIAPGALRPWHYADPFFQEAPPAGVSLDPWFADLPLEEVAERYFAAVGFDIRPLLKRADLYEKPGKCQHAFCLCVDRGQDIRVLCNLRPDERWMSTLLHELGHAVYDAEIDPELPYFLRSHAHILTTEASAMLFGRLSRNAEWLARWAAVPAAEARAAASALARATRAQLLVQTRWNLVMCHMERALYADPEQDLDTLWWDLVARFQGVPRPDGRRAPDWASKIHFSIAPAYYHNYLLGEMMASQLEAHILGEVLGGGADAAARYVHSPEVGAFLRERLYRGGRTRDWRDTLVHATGRPLDADAFVAGLAGAVAHDA
jgi:peptidyl-dipeptidase A